MEYGDKLLMALVTLEFFSVELVHYPALQYKKDERNAKRYYDSNNMHSFIIVLKPGPKYKIKQSYQIRQDHY